MKKILFITLFGFFIGCAPKEVMTNDIPFGSSMRNVVDNVFTVEQFDSICVSDSIPSDLSKWQKLQYRDFETGTGTTDYLFIKRIGQNEQIYRVSKTLDKYKVTKREVK